MDERDALIAALQQQIAEQQRQIAEKDRQIAELTEENSSLASQLEKQKEEIRELKQKLGLNSHNSSISSAKEGFNKPPKNKSLREPSGNNPGAQKGHKGANINLPHKPESIFRRNAENVLFLKSAGRTAKCSDAESAGMSSTLCCT